jgi:HD-GYP domain-containing protein (c-di-GMP phosphodiesterase class II)
VGKIHEEFAPILRKEGRLSTEERILMESHPVRSAELIGTISSLHGQVYKCVRHHHENFDGSGYPDGLAGEQIPLGARIIMVADTVDAMTTDRPYRKALPFERVFVELEKYSGKQFDPVVVTAFHKSAEIKRIMNRSVSPVEPGREPHQERVVQLAVR